MTTPTQPTAAMTRVGASPFRRLVFVPLCVFAIATASGNAKTAPPEIEERVQEVARLQESIDRAEADPGARVDSLDKIIEARAGLLIAAEGDDRAPTWMLDQASAILRRAGSDGADASVIYGIPTPQQSRRIRDAAGEASRLVRRADELAARIVTRLQETIFSAGKGDPAAVRTAAQQAESKLAILVDTEQAWRIGLLRSRAAVLLAAADDSPGSTASRSKLLAGTIQTLAQIVSPADAPEVEVTRRITLGAAKLLLVRLPADDPAVAPDPEPDFAWALQRLTRAQQPHTPRNDLPTDPYLLMQVASGVSLCSQTAQQAMSASEMMLRFDEHGRNGFGLHRSPAVAMLGGEVIARVFLLTRWNPNAGPDRTTPEQNAAWINLALAGLVGALDVPPSENLREQWRQLVYAKIADVIDPSMPLNRITPHAMFARALDLASLDLASSDLRPGEDAAGAARDRRHRDAVGLFQQVEEREDAGDLRSEALWEAASLMIPQSEQALARLRLAERLDASSMLLRLATQYPDSPRRRDAIDTAVWLTRVATPPGTSVQLASRLTELQQETRELAVALVPPLRDDLLCRLELGRMLSERSRQPSAAPAASLADARRAVQLLSQAAADPALAALADQDIGLLFDRLFDQTGNASNQLSDEDRAACAQAAVEWAGRRAPDRQPLYELALAEAWMASGELKAAKAFERLASMLEPAALEKLPQEQQAVLRAGDARIRLGYGRTQRQMGDSRKAFETLRKLADDLDHEPAPRRGLANQLSRQPEFWAAWTELIEMLAADNAGGERTATIRLQLNRLQLLDRGLGPEPYATRLQKIQTAIK
ncbi:MAG: hypothetical protein H7210_07895 [Pyrinomonadaceae bacterium]|nr:hypothetical protein [Phycisphaerales bacterium]